MKYLFIFSWLFCAISLHEVANLHDFRALALMHEQVTADTALKILTPTKGEAVRLQSEYKITWESKVNGNVQIDLYKAEKLDRTLEFAALNVVGKSNVYTWNVPTDVPLGEDYQIVIFDIKDKSIEAKSSIFSIQKSKKLPKWAIIAGSLGLVAIVGAVILIFGRPRSNRLPDPPNPDNG
jgi:hypothetical protein